MKGIDTTILDIYEGKKIALMFSGGKDSLALVFLLKKCWDKLTLYHINTGDLLPEINDIVTQVKALVPNFVQVDTHVKEWQTLNGLPSDLVPTSSTNPGIAIGMSNMKIVDRWTCCSSNLMTPAHNKMIEDGISLVIRGTKACDAKKLPHYGGNTNLGYQLWLPLLNWTHEDVFAYLNEMNITLPYIYDYQINAPECATCPAWWSEGRGFYLKQFYPNLYREYKWKLQLVTDELIPHVDNLKAEILS